MTWCKCGNCPEIRKQRGLAPFCEMEPTTDQRPAFGFDTYQLAAEHASRLRASGTSNIRIEAGYSLTSGSPHRFVIYDHAQRKVIA